MTGFMKEIRIVSPETVIAGILGLLLVSLTAGCGYRFAPAGENIGNNIKKVYVSVFTNATSEANIETVFRNAFINQIIKGRRFEVTADEERADAVLKGDIKNLVISHLAYRSDNSTLEKRITVTLSLALEEKQARKTMWRDDGFSQWGDYVLEGGLTAGQEGQKKALVRLADDAAERAYRMMVSDF